ncbi:universal stress protein [soil metagenome]
MAFRKILCPIDFSTGSQHALRLAVALCRSSPATLVISHAWSVPDLAFAAGPFVMPANVIDDLIKADEAQLAIARTEAISLGATEVSTLLLEGSPADRIVAALQEDQGFDLVVVGTHGESGLRRVLLGSVAEHVVRHAPCSVLVAHERLEDAPFRTVLCPVDFSDSARDATRIAAELTEPGGSGIQLLHAVGVPAAYRRNAAMTDAIGEIDRTATRVLESWAEKVRETARATVTAQTRMGRAGPEIMAELSTAIYDLVITGTHSRTGIKRALFGSVAEKLVRHAWCSVLVARTRDA